MKTFQFQILRFLPDRVNGEFINVGLILFDQKERILLGRVVHTVSRIHALFPDLAGRQFISHLKELENRIETIAKQLKSELQFEKLNDLDSIARMILPKDNSSLYLTETKSLVDINAASAFSDLFERLVNAHLHHDEFHHMQDREVWSHVYRKYFEKHGIEDKLQKHIIQTSSDEFTFEYSIKNNIWHCFESISFDLAKTDSIKNKVYKWLGKLHELKEGNDGFKIYLLAQMPDNNPQLKKFIEDKLNISKPHSSKLLSEIVTEKNAEKVIKNLVENLH